MHTGIILICDMHTELSDARLWQVWHGRSDSRNLGSATSGGGSTSRSKPGEAEALQLLMDKVCSNLPSIGVAEGLDGHDLVESLWEVCHTPTSTWLTAVQALGCNYD